MYKAIYTCIEARVLRTLHTFNAGIKALKSFNVPFEYPRYRCHTRIRSQTPIAPKRSLYRTNINAQSSCTAGM